MAAPIPMMPMRTDYMPDMPDLPRSLNLDPIIPVFKRILSEVDLIGPLKTGIDFIDSGPLINVCLVSLKSIPYAFMNTNNMVQQFDNGVSCRMRYLEAAVLSTASLVYNVVFGAVFSVLSLVTLGQVKVLVDQMRKHWIHSALALGALGVSLVGTVSPEYGIKANGAALAALGLAVLQWVQGDVIQRACAAYQRNSQALQAATLQGLNGDRNFFNNQFTPLFNYLNQNLNQRVLSVSDLMTVVQGARDIMPRVIPTATTEVITENVQRFFAEAGASRAGADSAGATAGATG